MADISIPLSNSKGTSWTVPGTDLEDNSASINLTNLGIAKFALVGSAALSELRIQMNLVNECTLATTSLLDKADSLVSKLAEINDSIIASPKISDVNSLKAWIDGNGVNFFTSSRIDKDLVAKFEEFRPLLSVLSAAFDTADLNNDESFLELKKQYYYTFEYGSEESKITNIGFSKNIIDYSSIARGGSFSQGQLARLDSGNADATSKFYYFLGTRWVELPVEPRAYVLPSSDAEIILLSNHAAARTAFSLCQELEKKIALIPRDATEPFPPNTITSDIKLGEYNYAKYNFSVPLKSGARHVYAPYPPKQAVADINDSSLIGSVIVREGKSFFISGNEGGKSVLHLISNEIKFVLKPSEDQSRAWRGQFADKVSLINQRSGDLLIYCNKLLQQMNFYFEMASNTSKIMFSAASQVARAI